MTWNWDKITKVQNSCGNAGLVVLLIAISMIWKFIVAAIFMSLICLVMGLTCSCKIVCATWFALMMLDLSKLEFKLKL